MFVRLLAWILSACTVSLTALASPTSPISYHGRIVKPDSSPEQDAAVTFKIQIRSPGAENCLMYEETQTVNMASSNGIF